MPSCPIGWYDDEDEVSYDDFLYSSSRDISGKRGYAKIKGFCKLASEANCHYGWIVCFPLSRVYVNNKD